MLQFKDLRLPSDSRRDVKLLRKPDKKAAFPSPISSFSFIYSNSKFHKFISNAQSTQQCRWLVPCGAALKPLTSLAEFSLKKRWRYMMRTSAWQPRFRTSAESLISSKKPSAAIGPRSASSSRENSFIETQFRKIKTNLSVCHGTWRLWPVNGKAKIVIKHKVQLNKRSSKRQNDCVCVFLFSPCQSVPWTEGGIWEAEPWQPGDQKLIDQKRL